MQPPLIRYTSRSANSITFLARPLAASSGGCTAGTICRRCWCNPRNAENLSATALVSARARQRFLTDTRGDDEQVIGRLHPYLEPRLRHPQAFRCR